MYAAVGDHLSLCTMLANMMLVNRFVEAIPNTIAMLYGQCSMVVLMVGMIPISVVDTVCSQYILYKV